MHDMETNISGKDPLREKRYLCNHGVETTEMYVVRMPNELKWIIQGPMPIFCTNSDAFKFTVNTSFYYYN